MAGRVQAPIMLALILIVIRLPLEELGVSPLITNVLGVNWLVLLLPIYFAWSIVSDRTSRPFRALLGDLLVFNAAARFLIAITYSLAYVFKFSATRFSVPGGGPVGEGVTAVNGLLIIPATGFLIGTIGGVIIGLVIGGIGLLVFRKVLAQG